jgi:hypothetical protein
MTKQKQRTLQTSKTPVADEAERSSEIPVPHETGQSSAKRALKAEGYEMAAVFFTSMPPREAKKWVDETFSVEQIVLAMSQGLSNDPDSLLNQWGQLFLQSFNSFNIKPDTERLVSLGVRPQTIAIAMMGIKLSLQFDRMFGQFGDKRTRRRRARALLAPLAVLEELANLMGELPPELPAADKFPRPAKIISDLKFLSSALGWGEWLYEFLGANSLFEVSKFALASLVREVTGKFHDREVSSLTAAALRNDEYDETRHRVWRISNYKRLQGSVSIATRLLVALNMVVSQSKPSA